VASGPATVTDIQSGYVRMNAQPPPAADPEGIRRRVAHELYGKLAFVSFLIWTFGTLILFIMFAASNPNPIPTTGIIMTIPLLPAGLVWVLYRPLIHLQVARRLRSLPPAPRS
jgi:hypothetical protein